VHTPHTPPARPSALAALAVATLLVAGLTACDDGAAPVKTPAASSTTAAPATQEPTAEPTQEPTAEPDAPAPILLSAAGIGDLPMGTPDPTAALTAMFGPPTDEMTDVPCGPGGIDSLTWNDLTVNLEEGTLFGWDATGPNLPAGVITQSGVMPGMPLTDATALPGASTPEYVDNMDFLYVGADDVYYFGEGSDPATATIYRVMINGITCD
jgi:hypothetical protein